jgi:hypothetical protein
VKSLDDGRKAVMLTLPCVSYKLEAAFCDGRGGACRRPEDRNANGYHCMSEVNTCLCKEANEHVLLVILYHLLLVMYISRHEAVVHLRGLFRAVECTLTTIPPLLSTLTSTHNLIDGVEPVATRRHYQQSAQNATGAIYKESKF